MLINQDKLTFLKMTKRKTLDNAVTERQITTGLRPVFIHS